MKLKHLVLILICFVQLPFVSAGIELLNDGSFTSAYYGGGSWSSSGDFQLNRNYTNYNTSPGYAYLANGSGQAGNNLSGSVSQNFYYPAGYGKVIVSFHYKITSSEFTSSNVNDYVDLEIRDQFGNLVQQVGRVSNLDVGSTYEYYGVTLYNIPAGNNYKLVFTGKTNGSYPSTLRIDDVSIEAIAVSSMNLNCISWQGGYKPQPSVDSAANYLCALGAINNSQNALSFGNTISKLELARVVCKSLFDDNDLAFLDNYPSMFEDLNQLGTLDQRYMKFMLYLEYEGILGAHSTDNISPYQREGNVCGYNQSLSFSEGLKALLEVWNLKPSMFDYDPTNPNIGQIFCDVGRNNKNRGWMLRANVLGILSNYKTTYCSPGYVYFGNDHTLNYSDAYLLIYRLHKVGFNSGQAPRIPEDFFTPNIFYQTNTSSIGSVESGVFSEYSVPSFNIPGGGINLSFEHEYHSSLTEIPVYVYSSDGLYPALQARFQPLGTGWTHTYNSYILCLKNASNNYQKLMIYNADGSVHCYDMSQGKYLTKGLTDKLATGTTNSSGMPLEVTITRGRWKYKYLLKDNENWQCLRLVEIIDNNGNALVLSYSYGISGGTAGQIAVLDKVTDAYSNRSLVFDYHANSNYLKSVTDPIGRKVNFHVNIFRNALDSFTDAKSNTYRYFYGNALGEMAYPSNLLTAITKPEGNTITNSYIKRKLRSTQSGNYRIDITPSFQFSNTQQPLTSQVAVSQNNLTNTVKIEFNNVGMPVSVVENSNNYRNKYDFENRIIEEHDFNLSIIKKYRYDQYGYLAAKVLIDSIYNDSLVEYYTNNAQGDVLEIQSNDIPVNTSSLKSTKYYYDGNGNVSRKYIFEGWGNQKRFEYYYSTKGVLTGYVDDANQAISYDLNIDGNVVKATRYNSRNYAAGQIVEQYEYDAVSRLIGVMNPNGVRNTAVYNTLDQVIESTVDPGAMNLRSSIVYNKNSLPVDIISPMGNHTYLKYDKRNDDLQEVSDGTNKAKYRYNTDGSIDTFINKKGNLFKYTYYNKTDFPNTLLEGLLFSDGVNLYSYDNKTKNITNITNSKTGKQFRIWSVYNRGKYNVPERTTLNNFFNGAIYNEVLTINKRGGERERTAVVVGASGKQFIYDRTYDYHSNIEAVYDPQRSWKKLVEYTYTKDSRIWTEKLANGVTVYYHYDTFARLDSIWAINSKNKLLYSIGASMDKMGNHTRENLAIYYKGSLVNTLPSLINGQTKSYSYNNQNRMLVGDGKTYGNNGAGEVTSISGGKSLEWNEYGQLTKYSDNGVVNTYEYDPVGIRRKQNTTVYMVDPLENNNVLAEATVNGDYQNIYIYGNGLVARQNPVNDSLYFYLYDFRGSVIGITDENGELVKYYQYDPWGRVYNEGGSLNWQNPFQYVGKWGVQKDENDVYYMQARYYQPSTGRFISEDPIWHYNLFPYADNDPINRIDPKGEKSTLKYNVKTFANEQVFTLKDFYEYNKNFDYNQIINQRPISNGMPGGPKLRYVSDPVTGRVMDMRHVMVVGFQYGIAIGAGVEVAQLFRKKTRPSALDPTDFFSNNVGAQFHLHYYKSKDKNKWIEEFVDWRTPTIKSR